MSCDGVGREQLGDLDVQGHFRWYISDDSTPDSGTVQALSRGCYGSGLCLLEHCGLVSFEAGEGIGSAHGGTAHLVLTTRVNRQIVDAVNHFTHFHHVVEDPHSRRNGPRAAVRPVVNADPYPWRQWARVGRGRRDLFRFGFSRLREAMVNAEETG
jgi:hypothetical protein